MTVPHSTDEIFAFILSTKVIKRSTSKEGPRTHPCGTPFRNTQKYILRSTFLIEVKKGEDFSVTDFFTFTKYVSISSICQWTFSLLTVTPPRSHPTWNNPPWRLSMSLCVTRAAVARYLTFCVALSKPGEPRGLRWRRRGVAPVAPSPPPPAAPHPAANGTRRPRPRHRDSHVIWQFTIAWGARYIWPVELDIAWRPSCTWRGAIRRNRWRYSNYTVLVILKRYRLWPEYETSRGWIDETHVKCSARPDSRDD